MLKISYSFSKALHTDAISSHLNVESDRRILFSLKVYCGEFACDNFLHFK